jgi:DNA-binding MarR family transcriptional regulator
MNLLTEKQLHFLRKLNNLQGKDVSVREIGREFFNTDASIYIVLNKLEKKGLIEIEKLKKELKIIVTPCGCAYIMETANTTKFK